MTKIQAPLQKRIKRHVIGRKQQFFAATAPGLEPVCQRELSAFLPPGTSVTTVDGGVGFTARLADCYAANLNLRTANRVLMRITSFHAANFRQLEKQLSDVPWELFLRPETATRIRVTSRHSRLYHKEAVAERVQASMAHRFSANGFTPGVLPDRAVTQQIFLRVVDNRFALSIDGSGELLHRRGIKPGQARAPLRGTLAAAALMISGYTGSEPLLDPMCGSGTFSIEAALIAQNIPPGWLRNFAFMQWPSFQTGRWRHLKREAEKKIAPINTPSIFSSDRDLRAVRDLEDCVSRNGLGNAITVSERNFFDFSPKEITDRPGLVTLNPPFGRRLGSKRQSGVFFRSVCERLKKAYKGWKFALIVPHRHRAEMASLRGASHPLSHGGIKVALMTGKIW